jgi:hypothetical protein
MEFALRALLVTTALFAAMMLLMLIGRNIGVRRLALDPDGATAGMGTIEATVFALLGLMIAFTFSGAVSRFDVRRQLVVEETNAIGTAYLRLDLLPDPDRTALRDSFRSYVDTRLAVYQKLPDLGASKDELAKSVALQEAIWSRAVTSTKAQPTTTPAMLLLPALNSMIDITTTRTMATQMHPPLVVYGMLFALALAGALFSGFAMGAGKSKVHDWLHMLGFAAATALTVYVILDVEYPRVGLIRVDSFDQALADLRASMK